MDDGKTFFAASSDNIPPFDYDGQQAVLADVFQCDGKKFVGYMERFTPKYHDEVVAHGLTPDAMRFGRELKKPGDAKWIHPSDLRSKRRSPTSTALTGGPVCPRRSSHKK